MVSIFAAFCVVRMRRRAIGHSLAVPGLAVFTGPPLDAVVRWRARLPSHGAVVVGDVLARVAARVEEVAFATTVHHLRIVKDPARSCSYGHGTVTASGSDEERMGWVDPRECSSTASLLFGCPTPFGAAMMPWHFRHVDPVGAGVHAGLRANASGAVGIVVL